MGKYCLLPMPSHWQPALECLGLLVTSCSARWCGRHLGCLLQPFQPISHLLQDIYLHMFFKVSTSSWPALPTASTNSTPHTAPADPRVHSFAVTTNVEFDELSAEAIQAYIASGEPFDKAGSYGEGSWVGRRVRGRSLGLWARGNA